MSEPIVPEDLPPEQLVRAWLLQHDPPDVPKLERVVDIAEAPWRVIGLLALPLITLIGRVAEALSAAEGRRDAERADLDALREAGVEALREAGREAEASAQRREAPPQQMQVQEPQQGQRP